MIVWKILQEICAGTVVQSARKGNQVIGAMTEKAQFSGISPMLYAYFDEAQQPSEFGLQPVERWSADLARFS